MALDGITLYLCTKELKSTIIGAKIDKVFQPQKDEIHLSLRTSGENLRLIISLNANDFRINLTSHQYPNPDVPPSFCMFLRKHLTGAIINNIEQSGLERIINFELTAKNDFGDKRTLKLIAELMGKYSNLIITDENDTVLSCLKHVTFDISRVRQMIPGIKYELPPTEKLNPLLISFETLFEIINTRGAKPIEKHISNNIEGISPQSARQITEMSLKEYDSTDLSIKQEKKLCEDIIEYFSSLKSGKVIPYSYKSVANGRPAFCCIPQNSEDIYDVIKYASANKMLDDFYHCAYLKNELETKKNYLKKAASKNIEKLSKRLSLYEETLVEAQSAIKYKNYADLVTANIFRIQRGMGSITVEDFYNDMQPISIPLNITYSPSKNAQNYYKKYEKLKTAGQIAADKLEATKSELDFLFGIEVSVDNAETKAELAEIEYDLIKAGYLKEKEQKGRRKNPKKINRPECSPPLEFLSSDGIKIIAGKNNRQNDLVTLRLSDENDIWLHAKGPGSHVLIKASGSVPDTTLEEAAIIAAVLSKQAASDKAAIDYTSIKNVWKANGAKPGMVLYKNYQTVYVQPNNETFEKLRTKKAD